MTPTFTDNLTVIHEISEQAWDAAIAVKDRRDAERARVKDAPTMAAKLAILGSVKALDAEYRRLLGLAP